MPSKKTSVIKSIFDAKMLNGHMTNPVVTLNEVSSLITAHNNAQPPPAKPLSTNNTANFFKDFIRGGASAANRNWPPSVFAAGYTGRQLTGHGQCFEFVSVPQGQAVPFPQGYSSSQTTPRHKIECLSLPLASRRVGRSDEPWLTQVIVRQRIIETHLAVHSLLPAIHVDHLQMSVKLSRAEIDALFLVITGNLTQHNEVIAILEAKGRRDDILDSQIISQVRAAFAAMPTIATVLPLAVKAQAPSEIYLIEFDLVLRDELANFTTLSVASEVVYILEPSVPGIGA